MQNSEKLCLRRNKFEDNIITSFQKLRNINDFSDVTLACEDGKQLEAHKVVLASSSPFFMELLQKNKHPHPLVYMMGVKYEDLEAIIDFLYTGEANVSKENLDRFLSVAEDLKLKGLAREEAKQPQKPLKQDISNPSDGDKITKCSNCDFESLNEEYFNHIAGNHDTTRSQPVKKSMEDIEKKISSMITLTDEVVEGTKQKIYNCNVCNACGKGGARSVIERHIEAKHITGVSYPCEICGKTSRSRNALQVHKSAKHK